MRSSKGAASTLTPVTSASVTPPVTAGTAADEAARRWLDRLLAEGERASGEVGDRPAQSPADEVEVGAVPGRRRRNVTV